jgi:hypothetical protein
MSQQALALLAAETLTDEAERLLDRAAALEDERLRLLATAAEIENQGLECVARFEAQRCEVMRAQARLHGAEVSATAVGREQMIGLREAFERAEAVKIEIWREAEVLWVRSRHCQERCKALERQAADLRSEAEQFLMQAELLTLPDDVRVCA